MKKSIIQSFFVDEFGNLEYVSKLCKCQFTTNHHNVLKKLGWVAIENKFVYKLNENIKLIRIKSNPNPQFMIFENHIAYLIFPEANLEDITTEFIQRLIKPRN